MRKSLLLAIGLLLSATPGAHAVSLKDCNQENGILNKIACLQANIILLNSSHEGVAAELRQNVKDLTAQLGVLAGQVTALNIQVGTLTTQVGTLTNQVSMLSGRVGNLPDFNNVAIEWPTHLGSCITYMGNNLVQLTDTCVDINKNKFIIRPFHQ